MGSSGKKRGRADDRSALEPAASASMSMTRPGVLEQAAEDHMKVRPVCAAERSIHAHDDAVVGVESKPDTIIALERFEVQISTFDRDLAGVDEERGLKGRPDLPPIFALQQDRVRSAEPIRTEAAQRIVS